MQTVFDQHEIQTVIERVRSKLQGCPSPQPSTAEAEGDVSAGGGIHCSVDAAVDAARRAFEAYRNMGLKQRHRIIDSVRVSMRAMQVSKRITGVV